MNIAMSFSMNGIAHRISAAKAAMILNSLPGTDVPDYRMAFRRSRHIELGGVARWGQVGSKEESHLA